MLANKMTFKNKQNKSGGDETHLCFQRLESGVQEFKVNLKYSTSWDFMSETLFQEKCEIFE